jgi:NADH dehydrogenase
VEYAGEVSGHPRPVVGLGRTLSVMQATAMEFLPGKLLTRDNLRSMQVDAVCTGVLPFGLRATPLEAVAPMWLEPEPPRARWRRLRNSAGR